MSYRGCSGWVLLVTVLFAPLAARADWEDYCPWVGSSYLAKSCGNGVCDGVSPDIETPTNCPVDCNPALVMAYYSQDTYCPYVTEVVYPTDTASAQTAIQTAIAQGKRINFGGAGHSANQIICNDGVVIRTWDMKDIWGLSTFEGEETVRFEAGVNYWELLNWLDANGRALDYAVTGLGEITVAGAIATGVHGTHGGGFASISHLVREIEMIGADGQVHTYSQGTTGVSNPDLWRALRANLGALGMMTNIRLAVRPRFNLDMRVDTYSESALLQPGGLASLSAGCSQFALLWFPGPYTESLIRLCGHETTEPAVPTAANVLINPDIAPLLQQDFRDGMQLGACYDTSNYFEELKRRDFFVNNLPLVVDPDASPRQHVQQIVGSWHRMQEWMIPDTQIRFSQTDWEVAVPLDQFDSMVNAIEDYVEQHGLAFSVVGAYIRLDQADDASLLGGNALGTGFEQNEPIVHFEIPVFIPWDMAPDQRDAYESRWRNLFKMLLDNYNVRPHWGKNQNWVFSHPSVLAENASRRARFQTAINQLDPNGVFARQYLARAGFTWPSNPGLFDTDNDGWTDSYEVTHGTNPDVYNGWRVRIDEAHPAGDCNYMDTWSDLNGAFSSPSHDMLMTQGLEFDVGNHNFTQPGYTWSPWPSGNGYITWGARFTADFDFDQAGTYCFSVDNGSTGTGIIDGRNACMAAWVDQSRLAMTGYSAVGGSGGSPRTGCVTYTTPGYHRLDIAGRWHDANLWRSFKSRVRWCYNANGTCTPNQQIDRARLRPNWSN